MAEKSETSARGANWLLSLAAVVIVIYGLKEAQAVVVPILLAVFLSLVGTPPLFWLRKKGVPNALAVLLVVIGMLLILVFIGSLLGTTLADFTSRIPYYEQRLDEQINSLLARLDRDDQVATVRDLLERIEPSKAMSLAAGILNGLGGVLNNAFLIVFTVIFILLEAWSMPRRLEAVVKSEEALHSFSRFSQSLNRYMALKTAVSFVTGTTVGIMVSLFGLDFPMLWGLLAFLLNYIPNIGSIIAAVPAVLLALIQLGPGRAVLIAGGYLLINIVMGNLLEPRIMGQGLGISTLVVFLSLVIWGWILGPIGMLLSVPLTMTLVIALESRASTRRFAHLLCAEPIDARE